VVTLTVPIVPVISPLFVSLKKALVAPLATATSAATRTTAQAMPMIFTFMR
jgi:hypothetical protein